MKVISFEDLLLRFLRTTRDADVRELLQLLGDRGETGLEQPFGPFHLFWYPFGGNPSNISSVNLGTKPGRSLTERLTNAIDAILESRVPAGVPTPRSPREAAQQWFGRPMSGPDEGLFKWSAASLDKRFAVILNSSGIEAAPTVDVIDDGTGISPTQFPKTILSLQSGNKIQKWYLIGAFGQGGASTLAFCEYALIVSRHRDNSRMVGFTLIKVLRLDEQYKEDTYAYLAVRDANGAITVPSCEIEGPLAINDRDTKASRLSTGTMVRHYAYKLPGLAGRLGPGEGNLYHYLHCSMFDPLIPFRVYDLREPGNGREELITGSRNRLMNLVKKGEEKTPDEESRTQIKHYRPMEFVVPPGSDTPSIGIEYWVVFNYRKTGKRNEVRLRAQSNVVFVESGHPVIGTLNGQNQGELTGQILREVGLGMVARHIVIHIDATLPDSRIRRQLFATTREGFKDGPVLQEIIRVLRKMLEEDEKLHEIEKELTEVLTQQESDSTRDEVKRQVTRLLQEAGMQVAQEGPSFSPGGSETTQTVRKKPGKRPQHPDPLPTLPFPEVTQFNIVWPQSEMEIELSDSEVVLVETNADAEFDRKGLVTIRTEPRRLEVVSKTPLRGGRVRWRLKPTDEARSGDVGKIIATITRPDGTQLTSSVDFKVIPQTEEKSKKDKALIPPFEIIPINPEDSRWATVWAALEDAAPERQQAVAYRAVKTGNQVNVFYSTVFEPFRNHVERLKLNNPSLLELFITNYEVWIGYHAILQENAKGKLQDSIDDGRLEELLEDDRVRVGVMQVKQAARTAELMQRVLENKATSGD